MLVLLSACAPSITSPTNNFNEVHVLAETQRFASILHVDVTAEVTDEIYMVPSSNGSEMVPAAGWYKDGHIKYWRPVIRERNLDYGTAIAAHEVCHSKSKNHDNLHAACINGLING